MGKRLGRIGLSLAACFISQQVVKKQKPKSGARMAAIIWPITDKSQPPPDFEEKLCARLSGRVDRAFFFGSFGTEAFHSGSDIDLILVCQTQLPFVERPRLFDDLYGLYPRLDLLVYTEEELAEQLSEPVGFWASVKTNLRELAIGSSG